MEFRLLAAAAIAVGATCGSLALLHRAAPAARRRSCDLVAAGLLAGIGTGRLWAMVGGGTNPLSHPLDVLIVRGGVDPLAAGLGALATVVWMSRTAVPAALDALAPGVAFGLAAWHAGCLARSACLGSPTGLPWGWPATGAGPDRHPVELYAALLLLVTATIAVWLWRRHPGGGWSAALVLLAVPLVRALTEPLRPVLGGGLLSEYLVAGALVAVAVAAALVARSRRTAPDR